MHRWAKPRPLLTLFETTLPVLKGLCLMLLGAGLYYGLVHSPPDYQQGDAMRIMYVHVPASWMALGFYTFLAVMSAFALVWKHPAATLLAQAAAPVGLGFTTISLVTGSIWGKPMWGAWWVWDARLTSVLILFFLYAGYVVLSKSFEDRERGYRAASILAVVGFINVPIIKFSVDWWNTLHQPASLTKLSAPSIHPSMLTPLLLMTGAFACYGLIVLGMRYGREIHVRKQLVRGGEGSWI